MSGLTKAEREQITRCLDEHGGVCREVMCDESLDETVRKIVTARERALAERIALAIETDPGVRLGHNVSVVCSCLRCEVALACARIARQPVEGGGSDA